jgi:CubicO group peptidase (beta-lactamase class C family)
MQIRALPEPLLEFARTENERLQVPGAAIGVLHDGAIYAGAVGITSVDNPLAVTPRTLFQTGSTSKTFAATALMQLVDEGRVDLDATVRTYLPQFALQSAADAARLTVRDLATHHTGFVGDYFRDTGRGDDAIARIVAKMTNSPQLVPAGSAFSYSNAAFYVLAHIVEVVRGQPFEQVLRERVFVPLGMTETTYFPEECLTRRVAAGHTVTLAGPRTEKRWYLWRSGNGASGVISDVVDQMRYAALHVGAVDAPAVLSRARVMQMQTQHREAGSMCEAIGISWMLDDAGGGHRLVKHGGSIAGMLSSFEMIPSCGFAVTVLTNADTGRESRQTIADRCQEHFLGFGKPQPRALPGILLDVGEYAGAYQATLERLDVSVAGSGLRATGIVPARFAVDPDRAPIPLPPADLSFQARDRAVILSGPRRGERVEFLRDESGHIAWLRWDGRLARRQPTSA